MSVEELIKQIQANPGAVSKACAVGGLVLGLPTWLLGARFNRTMMTLAAVATGGAVGLIVPRLLAWERGGAGVAVGAAVVLGVIGFLFHRQVAGISLGILAACWTALLTWFTLKGEASFSFPAVELEALDLARYAQDLWTNLPGEVQRASPWTCGAALLSGIMCSVIWPRIAVVTNWSLLGVTLMLAGAYGMIEFGQKYDYYNKVPNERALQIIILLATVAFGAVVQWTIQPRVKREPLPKVENAGDNG